MRNMNPGKTESVPHWSNSLPQSPTISYENDWQEPDVGTIPVPIPSPVSATAGRRALPFGVAPLGSSLHGTVIGIFRTG